jgi:hypothetical protein
MLGWAGCCFHKKRVGTRYTELVVLQTVGSTGHIVDSGASGLRNVDTLFVTLGWDRYGFHKMRVGTCYAKLVFLHPVGSAGRVGHFGAFGCENLGALSSFSGGPGVVSIKSALGHVTPNLGFCIRLYMWVT